MNTYTRIKPGRTSSIQTQIAAILITLITFILAGFGIYQYLGLKNRKMEELTRLAESAVSRAAGHLVLPLWNVEQEQIEKAVLAEMLEHDMYAIVVRDQDQTLMTAKIRDEEWRIVDTTDTIAGEFLTAHRDVVDYDRVLGTVEIYVTPKFMQAELRREIWGMIATIVVLDIALFAALAMTLRLLVIRPMTRILAIANATVAGDFTQEIAVHANNEIDMLAEAFRNMKNIIADVSGEMTGLAQSIQTGQLEHRGNAAPFSGGWRELVVGVNNIVDAFMGPFHVTADYVDRLSHGDIPEKIITEYQGDFNTIKNHLNMLIEATDEGVRIAEAIASGNLDIEVQERSKHDRLMQALNSMAANLRKLIHDMQTSMRTVEQQNWVKTGLAELSTAMRGAQEPTQLGQHVLTYLAQYLQIQIGAIYLMDDTQTLHMAGSYAYPIRTAASSFKPGEWLVGQAALEKHSIVFSDIPENYVQIGSGLGKTVPRQILVLPCVYEDGVKGVLELGTAHEFRDIDCDFLDQAAESIAVAIHSAQTRVTMQKLLNATQQQAEELQAQQEQLQEANQELEVRAQTLQESEQKLQVQQEELRQTNEELEIQTRTLEQQRNTLQEKNRALEEARKLIEEKAREVELASQYKSDFLANMSHELRTPLNSLLILAKLLADSKEGNLTDKQREFARTIHASGTDLLELINDVLDLSKIEAGKMLLHIEPMNLTELVAYIRRNFQHVAEAKGLRFSVHLAEGLPDSIETDRQRVEQIVKNFLSNAVKFTQTGSISVRIARPAADADFPHSLSPSKSAITIAVADTGVGIPEEKQALIFEAFQQADSTTSRKYGGTGLGLSISRELTRFLGGEIRMESEAGKGTTFTLFLPETVQDKGQQQLTPHSIPLEREGGQDRRNSSLSSLSSRERGPGSELLSFKGKEPCGEFQTGRGAPIEALRDDRHEPLTPGEKFLLIIEDDSKFARVLFDVAHERGFKALLAGDGAAGLQLACQYSPTAILLDIGLPDISGWDVLDTLKNHPDTANIPVHVITAQDRPPEAVEMGDIGYLTKPVTIEALNQIFSTFKAGGRRQMKHVLIVEDDAATRAGLEELLTREDMEALSAETGQEAYALLQSEPVDCLILDLGLPDMSGFDILETLRQRDATAHLPVIVYTGKELTHEEQATLEKYSDSIIIKGTRSYERLLDDVMLFLHRVETTLAEEQHAHIPIKRDRDEVLQGKTILVVDDDMRNTYALTGILEEHTMQVLMAENGKEALDMLAEHPNIDLVLMDMMMPEMDGYEAMQAIRKDGRLSKLPIIALTAKAMKGDRQKCIDAGANDYLSKPIDTDKLLSLLRVWLY